MIVSVAASNWSQAFTQSNQESVMRGNSLVRCIVQLSAAALLFAFLLWTPASSSGQVKGGGKGKLPDFIPADYDDYQNMLDQLGIKKTRKGRAGSGPDASNETTANPWKDTVPDLMTFKDGTKITKAEQWPKRRAEIVE